MLLQLSAYLTSNNLFCPSQSAYRPGHSTETALLKVMNDILRALDDGYVSVLTLLDLSAAFDTIDHQILLSRLQTLYGISGTALSWFESYLSGRTQTVTINNNCSKPTSLRFGVPQGSVLGPILFILYTKPLSNLIERHSISSHFFSDDTQLLDSCHPDQIEATVRSMQDCISEVKLWMDCNKLKLNDEKTESLLIKSDRAKFPDPAPTSVRVGNSVIPFATHAKNLGFTISSNTTIDKHATYICRSAYAELRRISSIRHLLTVNATKTLACAFILSKLDYCNCLLSGSPQYILDKLQKVQNSAARLVLKSRKHDHIQPLLRNLHWLPIRSRIEYKISTLCFNTFIDSSPDYLSQLLTVYTPSRQLRSSSDTRILRMKTKSFGQRSFSFTGPPQWNSLPYEIRHSVSAPAFKSALKTHLFKSAYNI